ncbi:Complex1_LYR_dom domain-containing protein, partial [Caenorhabditis elegans]
VTTLSQIAQFVTSPSRKSSTKRVRSSWSR